MASPEYSVLMKQLTRYRLSGLATGARAMEGGIEYEIESIKYMIDQNELSPEACRELLQEFQDPQKVDVISRPFREIYRQVGKEGNEILLADSVWEELAAAWQEGHNILIKGGADNQKCDVIQAACQRYMGEHTEFKQLRMATRKCTKRTSEMEVCYGRRRYIDNRIQLGYIAEGMALANEHPQDLMVLVLDEVDTMDLVHALSQLWNLLGQKGRESMICRDFVVRNCENFMLFVTDNMENPNRNVNMDSPAMHQLFHEVNIWNPTMEKQARHRMV